MYTFSSYRTIVTSKKINSQQVYNDWWVIHEATHDPSAIEAKKYSRNQWQCVARDRIKNKHGQASESIYTELNSFCIYDCNGTKVYVNHFSEMEVFFYNQEANYFCDYASLWSDIIQLKIWKD